MTTPLPTPPTSTDPGTFDARADAFFAALPTFQTEMDALGATLWDQITHVTDPAGSIGYGTGAGGTVTQATSKSTAVTLNKPVGQIAVNASSLAAGAVATFQLNNSHLAGIDILAMSTLYGYGTAGAYSITAQTGTGQAQISIRNLTGGALAEQLYIQFSIIKGATS